MIQQRNPKALRYVAAVAQLGSVQAAAREVSISASAIDRQILQLEEQLGVPLFERSPKGMRVTAAGEMLLALHQRIGHDLERTLSDLRQLQGVHHGRVKLAAMDSHANGLLPRFVSDLTQRHPGISLDVEVSSPDSATAALAGGQVDVAAIFNLKPAKELHILWSTDLPLGCVMAPGHALAAGAGVTLAEVAAWPLVAQNRTLVIRRYLERRHAWLLQQSAPPLTTNSLQLLKAVVQHGQHVALTSELDVAPELVAGTLRFLPLQDRNIQPQTLAIAISATRPLPRIARTVADLLVAATRTLLEAARAAQAAAQAPPRVRRKRAPAVR